MATITGTNGNDALTGTEGNDTILGLGGDDSILATTGDDIVNGGDGNDIVNYNTFFLNGITSITLTADFTVTKNGGGAGTDTLIGIETILGSPGSTLDARTAKGRVDIDLSTGTTKFFNTTVTNFTGILGSNTGSTLTGSNRFQSFILGGNGNDTIISTSGQDIVDGGGGYNTLDYSKKFGFTSIAPLASGFTTNAGTIKNIQKIIGTTDAQNIIDGTVINDGSSLNVNLAKNSLDINIPGANSKHLDIVNFQVVLGSLNSDRIVGDNADNIVFGSRGNDVLNGGGGKNTLNYGNAGNNAVFGGVKLSIDKNGFFATKNGFANDGNGQLQKIEGGIGTDKIKNFQSINVQTFALGVTPSTIDGSTAGSGVSINVNLDKNSLDVNNPGAASQNIEISGFNNVIGTNGNDTIVGNNGKNSFPDFISADDTIFGSKGNDNLDGGLGNNTLDYSKLDRAVTILSRGKIDKGGFGTDKVSNFQKIIGATNKANTIDASTADSGSSLDVNLAINSLKVNIPGVTSQEFEVLNFVNVIGGANNDRIFGGNVNSKLTGGGGNDTIAGGSKKDTITGTNAQARGVGEVDTLSGGGGKDKFILGDKSGAYYVGKGKNDYALITDFDLFNDSISIGKLKNYSFAIEGNNTIDLYSGKNVKTRDLIAKIQIGSGISTVASNAKSIAGANLSLDAIVGKLDIISGSNDT